MSQEGKKDPRYPIGQFEAPKHISAEDRTRYIDVVTSAPARLRAAVTGLSPGQLDTPYRQGGWTIRQVVHHVPDSHMNMYIRFKFALTETDPVIKPYDEAAWARLSDSVDTPIDVSLTLLDCLHRRWVILMNGMTEQDWQRRYIHPESGTMPLDRVLALYAWHSDHHIAHILVGRAPRHAAGSQPRA